ncbi:hypothetical protein IW261DRAFT_1683258 [Armillaria novae-zelandiae]|uniref:Uncharacterized protein n=1 Tax=Armillaria novae-zelandiae TaxID=153914 RepID=A0AA39UCT4_9AGAR|nr:hypothetical protein IW261DRAFT_1683258 [Armillaria novae-zelandiae]
MVSGRGQEISINAVIPIWASTPNNYHHGCRLVQGRRDGVLPLWSTGKGQRDERANTVRINKVTLNTFQGYSKTDSQLCYVLGKVLAVSVARYRKHSNKLKFLQVPTALPRNCHPPEFNVKPSPSPEDEPKHVTIVGIEDRFSFDKVQVIRSPQFKDSLILQVAIAYREDFKKQVALKNFCFSILTQGISSHQEHQTCKVEDYQRWGARKGEVLAMPVGRLFSLLLSLLKPRFTGLRAKGLFLLEWNVGEAEG